MNYKVWRKSCHKVQCDTAAKRTDTHTPRERCVPTHRTLGATPVYRIHTRLGVDCNGCNCSKRNCCANSAVAHTHYCNPSRRSWRSFKRSAVVTVRCNAIFDGGGRQISTTDCNVDFAHIILTFIRMESSSYGVQTYVAAVQHILNPDALEVVPSGRLGEPTRCATPMGMAQWCAGTKFPCLCKTVRNPNN